MTVPRPFRELTKLPAELRIPSWAAAALGLSVAGGAALGLFTRHAPLGLRLVRGTFFGSAFSYLTVSVIDFMEHQRLEKEVTGHYGGSTVVPVGESINHALTMATVGSLLALARPLRGLPGKRDLFVVSLPALHLLLGWRDELVYHRRRCLHREDIIHTVAHVAGAAMLGSFFSMRVVPWSRR